MRKQVKINKAACKKKKMEMRCSGLVRLAKQLDVLQMADAVVQNTVGRLEENLASALKLVSNQQGDRRIVVKVWSASSDWGQFEEIHKRLDRSQVDLLTAVQVYNIAKGIPFQSRPSTALDRRWWRRTCSARLWKECR